MPAPSRILYTAPVAKSPKRRKHIPRWFWIAALVVIIFGFLSVGLWYLAKLPYFQISTVEVFGTKLLSPSAIEDLARSELEGKLWRLIPRTNFFAVSAKRVDADIRAAFPQIADVTVKKSFPHSLLIDVRERVLWGVYCAETNSKEQTPLEAMPLTGQVTNNASDSCSYIDTGGETYQEFSGIEGFLLPMIIGSVATTSQRHISKDIMTYYEDAAHSLSSIGLHILSLRLASSTPDDATIATNEGWTIRITLSEPVQEWFSILKTLLDKEIGAKRPQLDYVDLRFGQKVFYKLR